MPPGSGPQPAARDLCALDQGRELQPGDRGIDLADAGEGALNDLCRLLGEPTPAEADPPANAAASSPEPGNRCRAQSRNACAARFLRSLRSVDMTCWGGRSAEMTGWDGSEAPPRRGTEASGPSLPPMDAGRSGGSPRRPSRAVENAPSRHPGLVPGSGTALRPPGQTDRLRGRRDGCPREQVRGTPGRRNKSGATAGRQSSRPRQGHRGVVWMEAWGLTRTGCGRSGRSCGCPRVGKRLRSTGSSRIGRSDGGME